MFTEYLQRDSRCQGVKTYRICGIVRVLSEDLFFQVFESVYACVSIVYILSYTDFHLTLTILLLQMYTYNGNCLPYTYHSYSHLQELENLDVILALYICVCAYISFINCKPIFVSLPSKASFFHFFKI